MSAYRRAVDLKDPENQAAMKAANAAVAGETGGRRLTMSSKDAALREKWMDAYIAAGGDYVEVKPKNKKSTGTCVNCPRKKTVTAKIVAVTFRSDHLDGGKKKLLKRSKKEPIEVIERKIPTVVKTAKDSYFGDTYTEFLKPEWDEGRGGNADSHPVSYTKAKEVKVDIDIQFTVKPDGQSASLTEIKGASSKDYLKFEKKLKRKIKTERIPVSGLTSKGSLPNHVDLISDSIDWSVVVDGEEKKIGTTGTHTIYVTFDDPEGKMSSPSDNYFTEAGSDQIVTETRLKYSVEAAKGTGTSDEKECVDAIFVNLMALGVGYVLYRRWENDPKDNTWIISKPTLHHYLWLCNAGIGEGECHNIAASFALACRIIGVQKSLKVGYMYPWPSRKNNHPTYDKSTVKSVPGKKNILGKFNQRAKRNHSAAGHGTVEAVNFLDGGGNPNNFEGVAVYDGNCLYAIGDDVFDKFPDPHDNSSSYFATRVIGAGIRRSITDWNKGLFQLVFFDQSSYTRCSQPYPWKTTPQFKWEE